MQHIIRFIKTLWNKISKIILQSIIVFLRKSKSWKFSDPKASVSIGFAKIGSFVTRTSSSRKHSEPCRFIGKRKKQKQLGSVSSLCVPCNNSLLNPRCPSVRPYGTTTRRFKTKHTYTTQIQRQIAHTEYHTYARTHTHIHKTRTHTHSLSRYKHPHTFTHTRARARARVIRV